MSEMQDFNQVQSLKMEKNFVDYSLLQRKGECTKKEQDFLDSIYELEELHGSRTCCENSKGAERTNYPGIRRLMMGYCTCVQKGYKKDPLFEHEDPLETGPCPKLTKFANDYHPECCRYCLVFGDAKIAHNALKITKERELAAFHLRNCVKIPPCPFQQKPGNFWTAKPLEVEKCICTPELLTLNDDYKKTLDEMIRYENDKTLVFTLKANGKEVETLEEFEATPWDDMTFQVLDRGEIVVDDFWDAKEGRFLLEASRRVGHPMFQDVCMDVSVFGRDRWRSWAATRILLMGDCTCNAPGMNEIR